MSKILVTVMRMLLKTLSTLVVLTCSLFYANAQTSEKFLPPISVGIYGGVNINMHSPSAHFGITEGDDPVKFTNSKTSIGAHIGGIFDYPLDSEHFVLSSRLGLNAMGVDFKKSVAISDEESKNYHMKNTLKYIELSPMLKVYNLIDVEYLYLLGGLELGIPFASDFTTSTELITSEGIESTPGADKAIPNKSIRMALGLGAGYTFEVAKNMFLSPEVSFRLPFGNVSSDVTFDSWSVPQLRIGVSLTFSLAGIDNPIVTNDKHFLDVGFEDIRYQDKAGNSKSIDKISVEELEYTELFPLLPYVFYDKDENIPHQKHQILAADREAGEFSRERLAPDAMEINMSLLDIIGSRMVENKQARININGTLDGKTEDETTLAKQRADFAKNYLIVTYGLDPDRIVVTSSDKPSKHSAMNNEDGLQENRRIEITTTNNDLLAPILLKKEKQRIANPEMIEFIPFIKTDDKIKSWKLEISQSDKVIKTFVGKGAVKSNVWNILPNELLEGEIPLDYNFSVGTQSGLYDSETGTIPVEYLSFVRKKTEERPDKIISKYSLVVFDFNSPDISDADKEIIEKHVIPAIDYNSTIQIYGYTDRIGDDTYNKRLAKKRADNVKRFIESKVKNAKFEVYGVGESISLFDNASPVGRQLSRTVQIYVVTPKK